MQSQNTGAFEAALRSLLLTREALGAYPLSSEQKRLWLLAQLTGAATLPVTVRYQFTGVVDIAVVQQNLSTWATNSEALCSLFVEVMGRPVRILMPTGLVKLEFLECAQSDNDIAKRTCTLFELDRGPLLWACVTRTDEQNYELLLSGHPIVVDEHSLQRIAQTLFQADPPHEFPPAGALANLFHCERKLIRDEQTVAQWQQWGTRLREPAATDIPTENPRPPIKGSHRQIHEVQITHHGNPLCEADVVASWLTVLMRWQGSQSALCGVKVRDSKHSNLIGPLQTYLPIRVDLMENSTLAEVRLQVVEQLKSGIRPPFSTLLEVCPPKRDLSRTPYFRNRPASTLS
ncbi:Linear gramicidin synthase subunit B [compost metagenome]